MENAQRGGARGRTRDDDTADPKPAPLDPAIDRAGSPAAPRSDAGGMTLANGQDKGAAVAPPANDRAPAGSAPAKDAEASPPSLRPALLETLAVVNDKVSKLSRKEQKNLLTAFDADKAESWERRKKTYERLLRALDDDLAEDDSANGGGASGLGLSEDLRKRLVSQVRSFAYASRGLRVPQQALALATEERTEDAGNGGDPDGEGSNVSSGTIQGAGLDLSDEATAGAREFLRSRKERVRALQSAQRAALETFLWGGADNEKEEEGEEKREDGEGAPAGDGAAEKATQGASTSAPDAAKKSHDAGPKFQGKSHDLKSLATPRDDQLSALIHLKALKVLNLQKKVRRDVLMERDLTRKAVVTTDLGGKPALTGLALFDHGRLNRTRQDIGSLSIEERKGQILSANLAAAETAQHLASRQQKAEERAQIQAQHQQRIMEQQRLAAEQRRKAQEIRERQRAEHNAKLRVIQHRRQFLQALSSHRDDQKSHNKIKRKLRKQRTEQTISFHSKERKKKIREANARVMALRTDNIEEYIKMAKEAKNSRISMLLENTEGLLLDLGIKVADQRAHTVGQYEDNDNELLRGGLDGAFSQLNSLVSLPRRVPAGFLSPQVPCRII